MRKIAEHQVEKEIPAQKEADKSVESAISPQVHLITQDQLVNIKLDDINAKLDAILQWIYKDQSKQETPKE